jgi:vacuolar protein-sorting-associated protein 4
MSVKAVYINDLSRFEKRIYIPLPGLEARKQMFILHVGDTPNQLSQKDFRLLAEKTDGYGGSPHTFRTR